MKPQELNIEDWQAWLVKFKAAHPNAKPGAAMNWYIKCGSYSEVQVVQCDMAYVGGLTQGLVGSKVVKRWHARKQEVRT